MPLFYGLLVHLALALGLTGFLRPPTLERVKRPSSRRVPVKVDLQVRTKTPAHEIREVHPKLSGRKAQEIFSAASRSQGRTPQASTFTYQDLLAFARKGEITASPSKSQDQKLLPESHTFTPGTSGVARQRLIRDASILSGVFDIPLETRRRQIHTSVSLLIRRQPNQNLKIIHLTGNPWLRAAIFEALQRSETRAILGRILEELQGDSLPLRLEVQELSQERVQDESEVQWEGPRLTIRKRAAPTLAPSVHLPDAAAEAARRQDLVDHQKLQLSQGFLAVIRNYELL